MGVVKQVRGSGPLSWTDSAHGYAVTTHETLVLLLGSWEEQGVSEDCPNTPKAVPDSGRRPGSPLAQDHLIAPQDTHGSALS